MASQFYTHVAGSTSKKQAGLWLGLAITTIALGWFHFQTVPDDLPVSDDWVSCMLQDVVTASTNQVPQTSMNEASSTPATEVELLEPLEAQCISLHEEFLSLQKIAPSAGNEVLPLAAKVLQDLRQFDEQYAMTLSYRQPAYKPHNTSDQNTTSNGMSQKTLADGKLKRTETRICFLQLVTAARRLYASLPQARGNANGALGCAAGMLHAIEENAVRELELEESANALSCLGVHWSVVSLSDSSSAPLFGSGPTPRQSPASVWVQDYWGTLAPADMVHAEDLLSRSVQGDDHKHRALSLIHARRLQEHAKVFESHEQHTAAAQRYQLMAKLAKKGGSAPLSAYALSHLSHSLLLQGSQAEALVAAKSAVDLTMDPLAQFVLATVRLSSGLLTTDTLMKSAEGQLRAVAGELPTDEMEIQRTKLHNEMRLWRWISNGNVDKCLWTGDAARFLICAMCKLVF